MACLLVPMQMAHHLLLLPRSSMTVVAQLSGKGFAGPKEVHVAAGATGTYPLSFQAAAPGASRGSRALSCCRAYTSRTGR